MYPTKGQLEGKWWHRLIKVVFLVITLLFTVIVLVVAYGAQRDSATSYKTIKDFNTFVQDLNESSGQVPGFRALPVESFISNNQLSTYSIGCVTEERRVTYLGEYTFKGGVRCSFQDGKHYCWADADVCEGDLTRIVKFDVVVEYGLVHYVMIVVWTDVIVAVWVGFWLLVYYKGFLYIVFGKKGSSNS